MNEVPGRLPSSPVSPAGRPSVDAGRSLLSRVVVVVVVAPVRAYQLVVSPLLGPRCRFYPSCSAYAVEALRTHGPLRGALLALWRLARCHPWNAGGVDLVPARDRVGTAVGTDTPDPAAHAHPLEHSAVTAR